MQRITLLGLFVTLTFMSGPLSGMTSPQAPVASGDKRTPINQGMLPLTINRAGSYYLAGNLTWDGAGAGITINDTAGSGDNRVSIDLNGFELRRSLAPAAGNQGIRSPGGEGNSIAIHNGTVTGFERGIECLGYGLRVGNVGFTRNSIGLYTGGGATITHCTFDRCGTGLLVDSLQQGQTFQGGAVVTGCTAHLCTHGFHANTTTTFTDCEGYNIFGDVYDVNASTLRNCGGSGSTGARLGNANLVEGCRFVGCLDYGIRVDGANNRIIDNNVRGSGPGATFNARGISFAANVARNVLAGNTVSSHYNNTTPQNYDIPAGNTTNQLNLLLVELPQTISWPCTVTLAGNLDVPTAQSGITVAADRVTIDLAGHSIAGLTGSADGIAVPGARRALVVKNGTIRGMGNSGIWASNVTSGQFLDLVLDSNGQYGLLAGSGARVEGCTASSNTLAGITTDTGGLVQSCAAHANAGTGINVGTRSQALDCQSDGNRVGIVTGDGCQVLRCALNDNTREGVFAANGCLIADCTVRNNVLDGIRVSFSSSVLRNTTNGNGSGAGSQGGILVSGNGNRIEGNTGSFEDRALVVNGTRNIIVKNTMMDAPVFMAPGNTYGPFINAVGVNDLAGVAGANHPWANFYF
ncbi:MAG: right-handed parallel beta-helix repeat-containing protein [Planctomycetes bacterium]|nr:right-handed parallel beta-helix repeat-containing protein [Planctomycetota bacterium]